MMLRNRRGSSSVLVILTFLLLMVFSILAISSSYADYRLAEKNADWTREYYLLEGEASGFISSINKVLKENRGIELEDSIRIIKSTHPEAEIKDYPELIEISRILKNDSGSKLLLKMEIYRLTPDQAIVSAVKILPEDFEYDESIEFEDVEVIEND
jgi:hypothetical protein